MKLTKKQLLVLAKILGAKEIKAGDRYVENMRLWCVAYSWGINGCSGRIYKDFYGNFFVATSHNAACYVGNF